MTSVIDSCRAPKVRLAKEIPLKDFDRSGLWIGIEVDVVVANHGAEISQRVGRECVLVGSDSHGFDIVGRLPLASGFLIVLVGNFVT